MSVCRARAANKGPASVLVSGTPALQSHVIVLRVSPAVPGSRAEGGTYLLPQVGRPTHTETTVPGDKPYPLFSQCCMECLYLGLATHTEASPREEKLLSHTGAGWSRGAGRSF